MELRGGEALDDTHRRVATGAVPQCAIRQRRRKERFAALCCKQCARQGQQLLAEAVGQQTVATDAHEAFRQHVQEDAAEEVDGVEGHDTLLATVGIISPAEADALAVEGSVAVIGDGHAVDVTAEVAEDMFRSAEGRLGIDVPILVAELLHQLLEADTAAEWGGWTSEVEQSLAVELAKSGEELFAEDGAQDGNRQDEQRMAGRDPALMISRQSAGGDDRVDMVMGQQVGTPRVQDGEESDLCAQPLGIGGHLEQGLGTGLEQQIEEWPA